MAFLLQLIYRLAFGLAAAMAATSPRDVSGGYFRVHAYVLLGLNTLALLVSLSDASFDAWPCAAGAALSYFASVLWLYEAKRVGRIVLVLVSCAALAGAWQESPQRSTSLSFPGTVRAAAGASHLGKGLTSTQGQAGNETDASENSRLAADLLACLDGPTSGLLLGATLAAMLLGHWYLNTPTMKMAPLRRLLVLAGAFLTLRMSVCGTGLWLAGGEFVTAQGAFLGLRWGFGLLATAGLLAMTWQTLKIPNTQSATGILYVAVIATLVGEMTSLLLSGELAWPV